MVNHREQQIVFVRYVFLASVKQRACQSLVIFVVFQLISLNISYRLFRFTKNHKYLNKAHASFIDITVNLKSFCLEIQF